MTKQPSPVTWDSISRHKFYDREVLERRQREHTVDDLRAILKGWTWERVVKNTISSIHENGVYFHTRIGRFMGKPCLAVCALDQIVVLRYIAPIPWGANKGWNWTYTSVIDGTKGGGFAAVPSDFSVGRTGTIKLTDPVIGDDA